MPWPQAQDYNEAIQNPGICFTDPDLRQARVKVNPMGLPVAISGAFASVYQLDTPTGKWAIRCFVREVADTRKRYEQISKALKNLALPCTAPFEFLPSGIRVANQTYPIVKMKWIGGKLISDYVSENISNRGLIASLAGKWFDMVKTLNQNQIAHGDLQHGNVLVVNHELMLIDYDGMFVPSLSGSRANELGHPDYQHPNRSETDFGLHIDNFSAWVIYAALKVLAEQPNLHSLAKGLGRDEVILFNREDFRSPAASPILSHIKSTADENTVKLCEKLVGFVAAKMSDIPPLDATNFSISNVGASVITSVNGPSDWWREHLESSASVAGSTSPPLSFVKFGPQKNLAREAVWFILISAASLFGLFFTGLMGAVGYGVIQFFWVLLFYSRLNRLYEACPEVAAKNRHLQEISLKMDTLDEKRKELRKSRNRLKEIQAEIAGSISNLNAEVNKLTASQGAEIREIHSDTAVKRAELEKTRHRAREAYGHEMQAASQCADAEVRSLRAQIANVSNLKASMVSTELNEVRQRTLNSFLGNHSLRDANIPGIGPTFKFRLYRSGIQTAADVEVSRIRSIEGFGHTRTNAVIDWKREIAETYQHRLPSALTAASLAVIDANLQVKRRESEQKLNIETSKIESAKRLVENKYKVSFDSLDAQETTINSGASVQTTQVNANYSAQIASRRGANEALLRNLKREETSLTLSTSSLQSDTSRLEDWIKHEAPRVTTSYAAIDFPNYLKAVFVTP